MLLLTREHAGSPQGPLILLFGLGMIGSGIRDALKLHGYSQARTLDFPWSDPARLDAAGEAVIEALGRHACPDSHLAVVWSAGAAGFSSSEAVLEAENSNFERVLRIFAACGREIAVDSRSFHFISSAGGLFEGQKLITTQSEPAPVRAYGHMKRGQERQLERLAGHCRVRIYRPSSVYGARRRRDGSKGLINNLLLNAARGHASVLDAHVTALRDYVYAGDIGRFVAEQVMDGQGAPGCDHYLLATGRSSSIYEIRARVERLLRKRVAYRLDPGFGNHSDITFHHAALPQGWRPVGLDAGIRRLITDMARDTRVYPA